MERLDAVVARVGYCELAGRAVGDAGGVEKLAVGGAARTDLEGERAVRVERLDAVVAPVNHGDLAGRAVGGAVRPAKLPVAGAARSQLEARRPVEANRQAAGAAAGRIPRPELVGKSSVLAKDLDAVVAGVGDEVSQDMVDDILRRPELPVAHAVRTYLKSPG